MKLQLRQRHWQQAHLAVRACWGENHWEHLQQLQQQLLQLQHQRPRRRQPKCCADPLRQVPMKKSWRRLQTPHHWHLCPVPCPWRVGEVERWMRRMLRAWAVGEHGVRHQ
jgi:hypothetical protein